MTQENLELDRKFRRDATASIQHTTDRVSSWLFDPDPRIPLLSLIRVYDYQIWAHYEGESVSQRVIRNFGWGLNEALHSAKVFREMDPAFIVHEIDDNLHDCGGLRKLSRVES